MQVADYFWLFYPMLFLVAFLYASVGHGGASGYLALMAIFGCSVVTMKSSSLLMNIFVSALSFYQFYKGGHFRFKLFYPFIVTSIPAAFIGAYVTIDSMLYKKILGLLLLISILRLVNRIGTESTKIVSLNFIGALFIGGFIGLISGMIGIGGGILLSPIILLLHWANMKETAAVSALFIFINSIVGFIGMSVKGVEVNPDVFSWLIIAVSGGALGSYLSRKQFSNKVITFILVFVLAIAGVKLVTV